MSMLKELHDVKEQIEKLQHKHELLQHEYELQIYKLAKLLI